MKINFKICAFKVKKFGIIVEMSYQQNYGLLVRKWSKMTNWVAQVYSVHVHKNIAHGSLWPVQWSVVAPCFWGHVAYEYAANFISYIKIHIINRAKVCRIWYLPGGQGKQVMSPSTNMTTNIFFPVFSFIWRLNNSEPQSENLEHLTTITQDEDIYLETLAVM